MELKVLQLGDSQVRCKSGGSLNHRFAAAKENDYYLCVMKILMTVRKAAFCDVRGPVSMKRESPISRRTCKEPKMERSSKSGCSFKDHLYPHDSEVCREGKCMICNDGKWEETDELFPPKTSGIFSP